MSKIARKYGAKPENHEEADKKFGVLKSVNEHFGAARNLPSEALEVANAAQAPFHDQDDSNSCTGHALVKSADARLRVQGIIVPYGSPLAAYTLGRVLARAFKGEPLSDDGAFPRYVMQGAGDEGVPAESVWPLMQNGKIAPYINDDLPPDVLQRGSAWKIVDVYRVYQTGQSRVDAVCTALAQKYPLIVAANVDGVFEEYSGGGPENAIPAPNPKDIKGGHMLSILGYKTLFSGKRVFLIGNHWRQWGNAGSYAWVSEEWLIAASDIYAFTLTHGPSTSDKAGADKSDVVPTADETKDSLEDEPTGDASEGGEA